MKNSIFPLLLLFITIFYSCESEKKDCDFNEFLDTDNCSSSVLTRSIEDARDWAKLSIRFLGNDSTKSAGTSREIESWNVVTADNTKSTNPSSDTLLYIFNFADSLGFSIIAADNEIKPILAVTESGNYDGVSSGNDAFDAYMEALKERLEDIPRIPPLEPFSWDLEVIEGEIVNRNVGVRWGQSGIYGKYCPNTLSGCVATAMAQIMAYHQKPLSFTTTVSMGNDFVSGESISLNWSNIRHHQVNHTDSLACTPYHKNIGALLREIGARIYMTYNMGPSPSSFAYFAHVPDGFACFGLNASSLTIFDVDDAKTHIKNSGPIFVGGQREVNDTTHRGHAWIVDGFKDYEYYRCTYAYASPLTNEPILIRKVLLEEEHVFHVNWGWNGDCNGYFSFGVFDIDAAESYDFTHNTTGRNYDTDLIMISVQPN